MSDNGTNSGAQRLSGKARRFSESVIREMTRHALAHGAVNLAQGFPDFPCPEEIKEAACRAIRADVNQYAITWGAKTVSSATRCCRRLVRPRANGTGSAPRPAGSG